MSKPESRTLSSKCFTHDLSHKWQFWVIVIKTIDSRNQVYEIEPIISVNTLELFIDYFNSLPKISDLPFNDTVRVQIAFFADDISPAWEDPSNENGGMYSFTIKKEENKENEVWKRLLVKAIRGDFDSALKNGAELKKDEECEVTGLTVARKHDNYMFCIWTRHPPQPDANMEKHIKECAGDNINIKQDAHRSGKKKKYSK